MKINKLIPLFLSLLLFCNLSLAEQSTKPAVASQTQLITQSPKDYMTDPDKLLTLWGDEAIPVEAYSDEEKKLQRYINEETAVAVATYSTKAQDSEWTRADHDEITPYTWKILDLSLTEGNGKTFEISLLRPNWWIKEQRADKVGNQFELNLPDLAQGKAVVKAIRINQLDTRFWNDERDGDFVYRPITSTFNHESDNVFQLYFGDNQEPLGVTGEHPIWSVDSQQWTGAKDLKIGETVKTRQGIVKLKSREKLAGTHKVYNLEIYRDHNYMVSTDRVLVHNKGPKVGSLEPGNIRSSSIQRNGERLVLNQGNLPTCGANSCAMAMDSVGHKYDLSKLILGSKAIENNGATLPSLVKSMKNQGINTAKYKNNVSLEDLSIATAKGKPAIVVVKLDRGGMRL